VACASAFEDATFEMYSFKVKQGGDPEFTWAHTAAAVLENSGLLRNILRLIVGNQQPAIMRVSVIQIARG